MICLACYSFEQVYMDSVAYLLYMYKLLHSSTQNDLEEFYAMVDFTNPGILGTQEDFRRKMLYPILRGREPDATDKQKQKMNEAGSYKYILLLTGLFKIKK